MLLVSAFQSLENSVLILAVIKITIISSDPILRDPSK